ncbi:hypothetical protein G2W53_034530 [Senna tora]|uniref:DUF4378 domain-containing protein n=1 Tax=Senna tora TaxID=362788 RepID=A0A834TB48_9FABA|nr:hypothetical protein G2W53_034530 [Senna tora]
MGAEKEGTKSGGYVGGIFQLFDWTSKSRKKLFATKSDFSGLIGMLIMAFDFGTSFAESSKQGKKIDGNSAVTWPYVVDEDGFGVGPSFRGGSDHSYASSVTDDESCGTRAPGVVARLMGLDSLPTSSSHDPYSPTNFDTLSVQDAQYCKKNLNYQHNYQPVYSGNLLGEVYGSSRSFMESKPQKTLSRPIEKFQTEVLPPKSAKSIPVTHHKLLSPIKNPGFIPTNNAAYIMEAAARIIEPGPQATTKAKTPQIASSNMSLKVRDLNEKVEASQKAPLIGSSSMTSKVRGTKEKREVSHRTSMLGESSQRSVESNAARYLKGQPMNKSWNGCADTSKYPTDAEEDSSLKRNGKSISLAIQAKVNVQRREGLSLNGGRSLVGQKEVKEHLEFKPNQPIRTNTLKSMCKKPTGHNSSSALKQNNLKQNCSADKDKLSSKPLVSNSHCRKVLPGDSSYGRHRSSNSKSVGKSKVRSRKSGLEVTDSEKEVLYTSTNNFPRKKRSTDKEWNDRVVDNLFIDKNKKHVHSNLVNSKNSSWTEEVKKKDMDVVSFTFTTPLTRNNPGFETSGQGGQKTNGLSLDHHIKRVLLDSDNPKSLVGYNVTSGDALGILLEQKLRELTQGVETSREDSFKVKVPSCIASNSKDLMSSLNFVELVPRLQQNKEQELLFKDKLCGRHDSDTFTDLPALTSKQKSRILGVDEIEECRSNHVEALMFSSRHPSPVSVLEPSFSTESCDSSISTDATNSTEGSKLCSSAQGQDVLGLTFSRKFCTTEADAELSDSASSTTVKKHTSTFSIMKFGERSSTSELDYVKDILCNLDMMFMDFSLGRTREIINPHLFNQLESRRGGGFESGDDEQSKIRRKAMFGCVSECLDLRCGRCVGGGCKMWTKGVEMVRRNEWLAEEVYKEISGWGGMGDSMVDELVDKDMSNQYGRWLDFEADAFELGVEVVDQIFNSLVDDIVSDILQL